MSPEDRVTYSAVVCAFAFAAVCVATGVSFGWIVFGGFLIGFCAACSLWLS